MTGFGKPDEKEIAAQLRRLKAENQRLKEISVGMEIARRELEAENQQLRDERKELKEAINRAKDMRPWQRPSFTNVRQLAKRAFLDIEKVAGGWVVRMGQRIGKQFKRLRDIWMVLTREDWNLHDEFLPYEETVAQPQLPVAQPQLPVAQPQLPVAQPQLPVAQPKPPTPTYRDDTPIGDRGMTLGALRAEWQRFPMARSAIAEACAKIGLDLALVTGG